MNGSEKTSPKDVFLHLLAIIALYVSVGGFVSLIFDYINIFFPDVINNFYSLSSAYSSIRWSISTLVIVFPVYVLTMWLLNRSYLITPFKRNLRVRKWLIYFTLFLAAIIMAGDLVTLVFNLLSGELTMRFLLKILTVFFVAGSVFLYYFVDVRKYKTE